MVKSNKCLRIIAIRGLTRRLHNASDHHDPNPRETHLANSEKRRELILVVLTAASTVIRGGILVLGVFILIILFRWRRNNDVEPVEDIIALRTIRVLVRLVLFLRVGIRIVWVQNGGKWPGPVMN